MFKALDPYLGLIKAAALVALALGLFWYGHETGADNVRAKWETERRQVAEATVENNRQMLLAYERKADEARKEKENAKIANDKLRNAVYSGARRLSIAVDSCTADGAGPGNKQARADIVPAVAGRIIDVGIDGDDAVRDLNECVDKYNAVRDQINGQAEKPRIWGRQ